MSSKNRLGKGLSALIPNVKEIDNRQVTSVDINKIFRNKEQPRKVFDNEKLEILSESIKNYGILQPIVVKKEENSYMIIAGERRFRAAKKAKLKEIPVIVKELSEREIMEIALIENLQREDLNAVEEAIAYKSLIDSYKVTQEELSQAVGKSRPHITNTIRLLNLNEEVIDMIKESKISAGHGKALLRITDHNLQLEVANRTIQQELSVREVEDIAKNISQITDKKVENEVKKDPFLIDVEDRLKQVFGTKVKISKGKKKGKIEIEYYNEEELESILEYILAKEA